jgi:hypothetical protein
MAATHSLHRRTDLGNTTTLPQVIQGVAYGRDYLRGGKRGQLSVVRYVHLLLCVRVTTRRGAYANDARRDCRLRGTVAAGIAGDHPVRVKRLFRALRVAGGGDVPRAAGHRVYRRRLHCTRSALSFLAATCVVGPCVVRVSVAAPFPTAIPRPLDVSTGTELNALCQISPRTTRFQSTPDV